MTNTNEGVPSGFRAIPATRGFTDSLQPVYIRTEGEQVSVGLLPGASHGNSMGIVHGGVLMTLSDLAGALAVNVARGERAGAPTVNMGVDFIASARLGQWLQADVDAVTLKRRFAFSSGVISSGERRVARFNGTFYLPDHEGMLRGESRDIAAPWVDGDG